MRDVFHNVKAFELIKAATGPTSTDDGALAIDVTPYNGKAMAVLNVVIASNQDTSDTVTVSLHEVDAVTTDVADLTDSNKIAAFTKVAGVADSEEVDSFQQVEVDLDAMSKKCIEAKITVEGSAVYVISCSLLCDQASVNPVN